VWCQFLTTGTPTAGPARLSMSEVACTLNSEFATVCRGARAPRVSVLVCTAPILFHGPVRFPQNRGGISYKG